MKPLWIIKIGGSVLTDKATTSRIDVQTDIVAGLCAAITPHHDQYDLIIVHGAGGYVHSLAKHYNLKQGMRRHPESHVGLELIHQANDILNSCFCSIAHDADLPISPVHPRTTITQCQGTITRIDIAIISSLLQENKIPVLYGEMVPDTQWDYSVCSGDAITAELVSCLPVEQVLFITDVDGIYTRDPYLSTKAQLIKTISLREALNGTVQLDESHNTDVTGGLRGKIQSCEHLFENDTLQSIHITNGDDPLNISRIFQNQPYPHTIIIQ